MCIHWCCKHCVTKLTHRWAYERCNEYFVARSRDENLVVCPNGPWLLRRAYHRHPYRGSQRCDQCKNASRKDKKLTQSARQKANVALGHRPDYNGAIYLGELKMRETIHRNSRLLLEPGRLDAMKAKWESFNVTHRHLPSHELEREWTKRFTASKNVDLKVGVSPSIVGLRMSPKHSDLVGRAIAGEASRSPHQLIHRQSILSTHEVIGGRLSQAIPLLIHCNHSSIIKWVNNTLEALSVAKQLIPYSRITTRLDLPTTDSLHQPKEHSHEARVTSSSSLIIFAWSQPTKATLPLSTERTFSGLRPQRNQL